MLCRVLCLALVLFTASPALADYQDVAPPERPEDAAEGKAFNTGNAFLDEAELGGGLYYFQRKRQRYNVNRDTYEDNLDHATVTGMVFFDSGYLNGIIGLDVGVYGTADLYSDASPDHELNFMPWSTPWREDWSRTDTRDRASIYKAAIKLKAGPVWLRAGYLQPRGPGVLGVNWSIAPGSYQAVEAGFSQNGLEVAAIAANGYKAPWFTEFYGFRKNDRKTKVDFLWSLGARYTFESGLMLEAAYGESRDYLRNAHLKAAYELELGPGKLSASYALYLMADSPGNDYANDNFDGMASQHCAGLLYTLGGWGFRLEGTHSVARQNRPGQVGYFAYRLVSKSGGAKGAYDIWWDSRSDFNHDNETALFAGVTYSFASFGLPGLTLGVSGAVGFDGKAYGHTGHLKEKAYSLDASYQMQSGMLKNASVSFHFTRYYNDTDLPSWTAFQNAFQDERDYKLLISIPF